jgi:hypothetical protein
VVALTWLPAAFTNLVVEQQEPETLNKHLIS